MKLLIAAFLVASTTCVGPALAKGGGPLLDQCDVDLENNIMTCNYVFTVGSGQWESCIDNTITVHGYCYEQAFLHGETIDP